MPIIYPCVRENYWLRHFAAGTGCKIAQQYKFYNLQGHIMKKLSFILSIVFSQVAMAADIKIENAWMRATAPGQAVAGAFMEITSPVNAKLVGATSPAAGKLELHLMNMNNGIMEMREVKSIDLTKGKTIKLAPGGLHIMLFNLKQSVKQGDTVPMTLDIITANKHQSLKVDISVRDLGGQN